MSLDFQKRSALKDLERITPERSEWGYYLHILYSWIPAFAGMTSSPLHPG
jgi:hypothetical protein